MDLIQIINNPIAQIIITIIIAFLVHSFSDRLVHAVIKKILKEQAYGDQVARYKRENTLSSIFSTTFGAFIWLVAIGVILGIMDFNLAEVATGAGFLGIIIGLGAQTTIKDYLAGVAILVENQYRLGDIVTLSGGSVGGETSGVIEDITLRITKLRDLNGTIHTVRNGEASVITNRTFQYSRVLVDIGVAYDSDIDEVEKTMNKVGKDMLKDKSLADVIKDPIKFLRVDNFADSAIIVKALGDVEPAEQWRVAGEYRRLLLKAFREKGIEIAFPQLVVHKAK